MSEFGFRMGSHGEHMQSMRIPKRKAAPRRNWKQQNNTVTTETAQTVDGLNSFGPTVDQMRNPQMSSRYQESGNYQTQGQGLNQPQGQMSSEAFKERIQQRRMRRQAAVQPQQQQVPDPRLQQVQVTAPTESAVQINRTGQLQQETSSILDMSASAGIIPDSRVSPSQSVLQKSTTVEPVADSRQEVSNSLQTDALNKKLSEIEKRQQEILVALQREEVHRRKLDVSIRALQQDVFDFRRSGDNPMEHQDEIRRELRELQHSLNNAMTETSNRMQEQIRVIIEQSEDSKTAITKSVDEMLHQYHDLLYWMYATVVAEVAIHEQCDTKSDVIAMAEAGDRVLLYNPMIEIDNRVWMACRNVDKMGNSKMGHICILEKPDQFWVTDFSITQ